MLSAELQTAGVKYKKETAQRHAAIWEGGVIADLEQTKIDGERYWSYDIKEREERAIWRKTWLVGCLASDVQEHGQVYVVDYGRDSVIISRAKDGGLHAHHNACTHRGTRLLSEGPGSVDNIRCPYHAWSFRLDGSLRSVPDKESFPDGLPEKRLRLRPVQVEKWHGVVFICMDADAPPLLDFMGELTELISPYQLDKMQLIEDQTVEVRCNWKAIIDNFSELYHVDHIHPQHRRFVDCSAARELFFDEGHTCLWIPGSTADTRFPTPQTPTDIQSAQLASVGLNPDDFEGRVEDVPNAVKLAKRARSGRFGYDYSNFNDAQLIELCQPNIFPNIILSGAPEGFWLMRVRPHPRDPAKCYLDKWTLALKPDPNLFEDVGDLTSVAPNRLHQGSDAAQKTDERPQRDCFTHDDVTSGRKSMTDTIDQDISLLERVQQGAESIGFETAWLSGLEARVSHFHKAIDAALSARPAK